MNSESQPSSPSDSRPNPKSGYIDNVDELIHRTPLSLVLQHYGLPQPENSAGEYRMKCVFNEACSDSQYGNLTVRQDVAKQIYCHSCNTRGNLLVLIHGLETHQPPDSGRLRGQEFKNAVNKLRQINGEVTAASEPRPYKTRQEMQQERRAYESTPLPSVKKTIDVESVPAAKRSNTPLLRHDNNAARAIADLAKDLIVDVSQMSPEAAQYVRKRPWMTPELLQKWGAGWIAGNGRSMFRKNYFVYTHRNERGEVVSYSGRDLNFETKWDDWIRNGKPEGKKPGKHRYVSGFHRGLELCVLSAGVPEGILRPWYLGCFPFWGGQRWLGENVARLAGHWHVGEIDLRRGGGRGMSGLGFRRNCGRWL